MYTVYLPKNFNPLTNLLHYFTITAQMSNLFLKIFGKKLVL